MKHQEYKEEQLKKTQVSVSFDDLVKTVEHLIERHRKPKPNQRHMSPKNYKQFIEDPIINEKKKDPRPNYRLREYKYCANCYYCTVDTSDKNNGDTFICYIEDNLKDVLPNCVCDNYKKQRP